MVIYEVNLFINKSIFDDYKKWLEEHITEMLMFQGFSEAKILSESDFGVANDNNVESKLTVQYVIQSRADLNDYFEKKASIMRKKGTDLFGDRFRAERRILNIESSVLRS